MTEQEMDQHIAVLVAELDPQDMAIYAAKMRAAIENSYSQQIASAIYDAVHDELLAVKCKLHPA